MPRSLRNLIYLLLLIFVVSVLYFLLDNSNSAIIDVVNPEVDSISKDVLNNVKAKPRELENEINVAENEVLEEPENFIPDNNQNQVLPPPNIKKQFSGNNVII